MKHTLIATIMFVLGLASASSAEVFEFEGSENHAVTWRTNIVNGSLTVTNNPDSGQPWAWSGIEYTLPQNWSNTFVLSVVRSYDVDFQYQTNDIRTNVFGDVETNISWTVTNTVERFQTVDVFRASTTNISDHVWAREGSKLDGAEDALNRRLPTMFYVLPGDRLIFSMTATNIVPFSFSGAR